MNTIINLAPATLYVKPAPGGVSIRVIDPVHGDIKRTFVRGGTIAAALANPMVYIEAAAKAQTPTAN